MTNKSYIESLLADAHKLGICKDGYKRMLENSRDGLLKFYLECPDWCLERNFPNLADLKENWTDCEDYGVFVGKQFKGETLSGLQAYIFHNCTGHIHVAMDYEKAIIPMLYFANNCRISVKCNQQENKVKPIIVPIYEFGKNQIKLKDNLYARFNRVKHNLIG